MSMLSIARIDLERLFVRPFAWILAALTLAVLAWFFLLDLNAFLAAQPRLATQAGNLGYTDLVAAPHLLAFTQLSLLLAPLLTMHALAGERRTHTLPLLFAAGLSPARIVLGKFLAVLAYLGLLLALVALMPAWLAHATSPDWGQYAAALLGCALCIAALTAIGIAASAFASHPALAATAALLVALALTMLDAGARLGDIDTGWLDYLSLPAHLTPFMHGLVRSVDVIYFLLIIAVSLALASRRLAADKVRG
ncbi:MAG: ABC transporter permease [Proteobacteria bacterium]|nr:ABC transporter permease [Pseudomonadota bacterium]